MKYPAKVALRYRGYVAVERKGSKGQTVFDVKRNVDSPTLSTEVDLAQARAAIEFHAANPWAAAI